MTKQIAINKIVRFIISLSIRGDPPIGGDNSPLFYLRKSILPVLTGLDYRHNQLHRDNFDVAVCALLCDIRLDDQV